MLKILMGFLITLMFTHSMLSANNAIEARVNQIAKGASAKIKAEIRRTLYSQMRVVEKAKIRHRRLEEAERNYTRIRKEERQKAQRVRYAKRQRHRKNLKKQEHISTPETAKKLNYYDSNLLAKVDLSSQRMHVYLKGDLLYSWKVSTGRKGYYTPTGNYKPKRMTKMHYSRKYHNSAMPYSVFFRGGYAIHGTKSVKKLGRKASHGCIRLRTANAKKLYALIKKVGKANSKISIVH